MTQRELELICSQISATFWLFQKMKDQQWDQGSPFAENPPTRQDYDQLRKHGLAQIEKAKAYMELIK